MPKRKNELEEHEKPSTKRQRFKSGPANQKFLPLYHELWPCLERSDKGDTFAKCTVCNLHFCCIHSGRYDCKRYRLYLASRRATIVRFYSFYHFFFFFIFMMNF